jgi:hypothetical protein
MSWQDTGVAVGTMATGLSALTAAIVWIRKQVNEWQADRLAKRETNWQGYIPMDQVFSCNVRLVEDTLPGSGPIERVVLDVMNPDNSPNPQMAHGLRTIIKSDGTLSRSPTQAQFAFLVALRNDRVKTGFPIS